MISNLLTAPAIVGRAVPTDAKDEYGKPVIDWQHDSTVGYCQIETQFADPAQGLDGNSVRIYLPAATNIDWISTVEIEGYVYEVRGKPHMQWNPRTRSYEYVLVRGRRAE